MTKSFHITCIGLITLLGCLTSEGRLLAQDHNVSVTEIANGIWRIRYGIPETFVPTHFRSGDIQTNSLLRLPSGEKLPFAFADIDFEAASRGLVVSLPMGGQEHVYGLGLSTKVFEKTGDRQILIPSDNPEVEDGPSHAPVPFYVSTAGYGVLVDTARYTTFRAGTTDLQSDAPAATGSGGGAATSTAELYRDRKFQGRRMLVEIPAAQGIDLYVFAGPGMVDAVARYNLFSGGGAIPPLWVWASSIAAKEISRRKIL